MAVSKGTTTEIDASGSVDGLDCARISDTEMLVAYLDTAGTLGARVCDINTGTKAITPNAQSSITHGFQLREISLVRLSSTKFLFVTEVGRAQVLNVSGTTVTGGPIKTLTDDPNFGVIRLIPITSTTALYTYGDGSDILARVLSVDGSDNITESSSVIAANATSGGIGIYDSALYTPTKAVVVFQDDASSNFFLMGQLLTISGATVVLDGSAQTLYDANQGWNSSCAAAEISTTEIVTAHNVTTGGGAPQKLACHVVTLSGSALSAGSTLDVVLADFIEPFQAVATNNETILLNGGTSATSRVTQITKSGTTLSHAASDFVDITVNTRIILDSMKKIADDFVLVCTIGTADGSVIGSDVSTVFSGFDLVLGGGQP